MANIPAPEHPDRWLYDHLSRIEKLLLALNLALPDQEEQMVLRAPSRSAILEEALGAIYPDARE